MIITIIIIIRWAYAERSKLGDPQDDQIRRQVQIRMMMNDDDDDDYDCDDDDEDDDDDEQSLPRWKSWWAQW